MCCCVFTLLNRHTFEVERNKNMSTRPAFQQRTKEHRERLSEFLNFDLYIYETWEICERRSREHFSAHLDYQIELEKRGVLFGAGPLYEAEDSRPSAGLIIVRAENIAMAREIADQDPMHKFGAREYRLRRWKLNEGSFSICVKVSNQSVVFE